MRQIVKDYGAIVPLKTFTLMPDGGSLADKNIIFNSVTDVSAPISVLDIGFGVGGMGHLIKGHSQTAHWNIDGLDAWEPNCHNQALISQRVYRNVWHGLVQQLDEAQLRQYDVICLMDVIEHLDVPTAKAVLTKVLTHMREDARFVMSTPLWFFPQDEIQSGDFEKHLICVPATAVLGLLPLIYSITPMLIGNFVFGKKSLDTISLFQPVEDQSITFDKGWAIVRALRLPHEPGVAYSLPA